MTAASSTSQATVVTLRKALLRQSAARSKAPRTLQDVLLAEGVLAVQLAAQLDSLAAQKTYQRLKTNLMKLGFLARALGKPDRLQPVVPTPTACLILLHHLFALHGPRTVEMRSIFANPFWQYLGFKFEDAVRAVLRRADAAGVLGKYVVADQLELITTCVTLDELLTRKVRL